MSHLSTCLSIAQIVSPLEYRVVFDFGGGLMEGDGEEAVGALTGEEGSYLR